MDNLQIYNSIRGELEKIIRKDAKSRGLLNRRKNLPDRFDYSLRLDNIKKHNAFVDGINESLKSIAKEYGIKYEWLGDSYKSGRKIN